MLSKDSTDGNDCTGEIVCRGSATVDREDVSKGNELLDGTHRLVNSTLSLVGCSFPVDVSRLRLPAHGLSRY